MKHAKRIGALICVIAICFTLICAPSAHAVGVLGGQSAGAFLAAGLVALNIVVDVAIGSIGNYFGWQGHPTNTTLLEQDISYTYPVATEFLSNYLNASTIKVRQGVTIIDGVEYDEVFIDPGEFTTGLKTDLFDFKTKWNILSGQSGLQLASGAGDGFGLSFYDVSNTITTQKFTFSGYGTFQIGDWGYPVTEWTASYPYRVIPVNGQLTGPERTSKNGRYTTYFTADATNGITMHIETSGLQSATKRFAGTFNRIPFDYKYVSGVVPGEESDIPDDFGLSIQIPHDQLQTFYNTYPQYNVDNSVINIQEDQIDIDELTQAIFDQISSMEEIKAEWKEVEEPVPPEPEPPGPAEDVLTGVNTIIGQQNTQISQNQQDLQIQQQQLQQQQQQLQQQQQISTNTSDIKDAIENVTEVPTSEQLPEFKFDLRELFPFCIPFDIYHLLSSFDAEPQAPHVQLPIVINSIGFSYNLDLDFSAWNTVAQAMRTAELIVYAIGLAWATGKVIKW